MRGRVHLVQTETNRHVCLHSLLYSIQQPHMLVIRLSNEAAVPRENMCMYTKNLQTSLKKAPAESQTECHSTLSAQQN